MSNLQNFKFLEYAKTVTESNVMSNPNNGSQLLLQVTGSGVGVSLKVYGLIDNEKDVFFELASINLKDFSTNNAITSNGIYAIGIDGISRIKVKVESITSGNVNVFGKVVD